eukprot:gb/GECH01009535.1/.p1 GENE.gb/GECH01009535.1/~~gb/GECH01009535.1/.p1  ORF type:complete len:414 (+),score=72.04 gb/GECH01009535.1/:1-1242(+)
MSDTPPTRPGDDGCPPPAQHYHHTHDTNNTQNNTDAHSNNQTNSHDNNNIDPTSPTPFILPGLTGCRSVDNFEKLNEIDQGTYGVVFRARDLSTGEVVALKKVKFLKEQEGFPLTSIREINILLTHKHPNIVDLKEIVVGSTVDSIFMVMEYLDHELKDLLKNMKLQFSMAEVKCLMKQLLAAVRTMHSNWILHRDLKTSNLLLNNKGILKVCDFGMSRLFSEPPRQYTPGVVTLWYRAPEILLGDRSYSQASDMWSVGCIFAEIMLREGLFQGRTELEQLKLIFREIGTPDRHSWPEFPQLQKKMRVNFPRYPPGQLQERFPRVAFGDRPSLSETGLDLLTRMLTCNPHERITAREALKHPWFAESPKPKDPSMMPTFPSGNELHKRKREMTEEQKLAAALLEAPAKRSRNI